jgi:hypothetical protein
MHTKLSKDAVMCTNGSQCNIPSLFSGFEAISPETRIILGKLGRRRIFPGKYVDMAPYPLNRREMDKIISNLRNWWLWHITIPFGAIRLLADDYREEIQPIIKQEKMVDSSRSLLFTQNGANRTLSP